MRSRSKNNIKRLAIGSGLAAVAGYLVGVLTAPKSGSDTRDDISDSVARRRKQSEKELKKLNDDLSDVIDDAKKRGDKVSRKTQSDLKDVLERAVDTKEKVREVLSAMHEGDAGDQDLKRAIKNGSQALEHLRDFIKK